AHQVKIVKRTEGWQGTLELQAFQVPNGQFQPPPALPSRKLLCIGDSITAGSGTDVKDLVDTRKDSYTSNGRLSYAYRLADRLDAQVHLIAFGGRGLIRDWQGKTDTGTAPQYYERTLATNTNYQWDQSRYQPDAISICLGTNDFNPGIIPPNEYSEAYASFVRKLHQDHPKAKIFLLGSPMFGQGDLRDSLNEAIDLTIQKVEELEGLTITKVDVGYYPGRPNVDSHPVSSEHRRIATELEPVFRQVLGW
ncbi:MAG: GDSL-type esterase/lipase family protein, partial [Planctomycetota bacterium]